MNDILLQDGQVPVRDLPHDVDGLYFGQLVGLLPQVLPQVSVVAVVQKKVDILFRHLHLVQLGDVLVLDLLQDQYF